LISKIFVFQFFRPCIHCINCRYWFNT